MKSNRKILETVVIIFQKKVMVEKLMNKNGKELFKKFIEEEKELERLTEVNHVEASFGLNLEL